MMQRIAVALLVAGITLAALAWWVLESSGVAIVETHTPEGGLRSTHVWYARSGDAIWLEAGRPEHPWYQDIRRDPHIVLRADGESGEFDAATVPGRSAHEYVRRILREKYGLRDRLLGWVVDTSPSIAVRLTPIPVDPSRAD